MYTMSVWGYLWILLGYQASVLCYQGGACNFLNQQQANTNANNRVARGLAAFRTAFRTPAFALAA